MATTGNVSSAPQLDDTMIDVDTTSTNNDGLSGSLVYPQDAMSFPFMQIVLTDLQPAKIESSSTIVSSAASNALSELPTGIRNTATAGLARIDTSISTVGGLLGIDLGGIGDWLKGEIGDLIGIIGEFSTWVDAGKVFPDFGQDTDTKSVNLLTRFANGAPAKIKNVLSKPRGSIVLPMPTSFSDGASGGWGSHSMSLGGDAVTRAVEIYNQSNQDMAATAKTIVVDEPGKFLSSLTKEQMITGGALLVGKGIGMGDDFSVITKSLINPRMTMKFDGRDIRTFSFEYVLAPRNEKEVKAVMAILLQLKLASYPSLGDSGGFTLKYNTELEIHFFDSNGNPYQGLNRALPKILPCVITDLVIQYSSNQTRWSALGGSEIKFPTHTKLAFTVSETKVLHTGQIQMEGY